MAQVVGSLVKHPARVSFEWYAATILIGGTLLAQPLCEVGDRPPVSLLDGIFTATSALCVTGLTVRSTGNDFSLFGQFVILALIELGGIGIITVTTFLTLQLSGRQRLRERTLIAETLGAGENADVRWVLSRVLVSSLLIQSVGVVLLTCRFLADLPWPAALWHAVFHAVSAFCNAGFGLRDDSLTGYQGDVLVNATIIGLIVLGGIGFPVMLDVLRQWSNGWRESWTRLLLHSKIMLLGTAILLAFGAVAFGMLEWDGAMRGMPWHHRLYASLFQSATCRTAGFNTVDIGSLTNATLFVMMLLMFVGAGPCSTGGGVKVSTLAMLLLRGWSSFRGQRQVSVGRRTVPERVIDRAEVTTLLYAAVAFAALTILLVSQQAAGTSAQTARLFLAIMFEAFSALGTVGLSTGITPHLTAVGKMIIILLMFLGRLGPITVMVALSRGGRETKIEYAPEEPLIG